MEISSAKAIDLSFAAPPRHRDAVVIVGDPHYYRCGLLLARQLVEMEQDRRFDICVICSEPVDTPEELSDGLRIGLVGFSGTEHLHTDERISPEAYLRIYLPHEMKEYRRICYLDADILLNRPGVQTLIDVDMQGQPIAAVADPMTWMSDRNTSRARRYRENVAQAPDNYFNSGVLVIDVAEYNRLLPLEVISSLIAEKASLLDLHDQTFLNMEFSHRVRLLSPIWNFPMLDQSAEALAKADPVLLHFIGVKPWHDNVDGLRKAYFHIYRDFLSKHFGYTDFKSKGTIFRSRESYRKHKSDLREWYSRRKVRKRIERAQKKAANSWAKEWAAVEKRYPRNDPAGGSR